MGEALRWGVIGCGDVVFHKSGPSILAAGQKIAAVMRRDPSQAEAFAAECGAALCCDDAEAVLCHPEVDAVYVATPPSTHAEYVLAAARAGKPVLVEKPQGMTAADSDRMIAACEKAGVELFVAYYRRFWPQVVKMRELLAAGAIGRPVQAQIEFSQPRPDGYDWGWRVQPEISGGGLFVDVVSHRIDAMVSLLGGVEAVSGVRSVFEADSAVEQAAALSVKFASGVVCGVMGDFQSSRFADRFLIAGEAGTIRTDNLDGHAFVLETAAGCEEFSFERFCAPHLGLFRHIGEVLAGRADNASSGRDARITDAVLDAGLGRAGA